MKLTGYTGMEYPSQFRDGVSGSDHSLINDQYMVSSGSQCYYLIDNHLSPFGIYHFDWLYTAQATSRTATSPSPLVLGPVRYGDQYRGHRFPVAYFRVRILPFVYTRHARDYELERGHVHRRHWNGIDLLLGSRSAFIRSTRGVGQARRSLLAGFWKRTEGVWVDLAIASVFEFFRVCSIVVSRFLCMKCDDVMAY